MSVRRGSRCSIILSLAAAAVLLFGCGRSDSSVEAVEYRPVSFVTGELTELIVNAVNGSVSIQTEVGRATTSVTAILRASGRSLNQAQQRVEGLPLRMIQQGNRVELSFEPPEAAADWRKSPSVLFEVRLPAQALISVESTNGTARVGGVEGDIAIDMAQGTIEVVHSAGTFDLHAANGEVRVVDVTGVLVARGERSDIIVEASEVTADLETSIGNIAYSGRLVGANHRIHASNGSITLSIPTDSELQLEAEAATGGIESRLPFVGDTDGWEWSAVLNAATSIVSLRATHGWIRISALDNI